MASKIYKFFEYLYLVMAVISIYEVITSWNDNRDRAYIFIILAFVGVFMFFFKRIFRKKIEARRRENQEQNN